MEIKYIHIFYNYICIYLDATLRIIVIDYFLLSVLLPPNIVSVSLVLVSNSGLVLFFLFMFEGSLNDVVILVFPLMFKIKVLKTNFKISIHKPDV